MPNGGWRPVLRRIAGVVVAVLSLLAGLPVQEVHASVYQASAESVAPQWINASSRPVAVLGLNLSQNAGERLLSVGVNFTDVGADGRFNSSDLAPLARDASSGVALYLDNKTAGSLGAFDGQDVLVRLVTVPQWTYGPGQLSTELLTDGAPIPDNDLGNNTGSDFFIVVRTSAAPSGGDDFSVSLGPGDVRTDDGTPDFPPVETAPVVFDIASPHADAGPDVAVDEGLETGFSAAASTDNIGITNYTWMFGDFGPGNTRYGVYVTYTFILPGKFLVLLNVTDYAGNSDESILLVTVRNLNQPPVIISTPPLTAWQGKPYAYLLQASDPDGDALRFNRTEPIDLTINSTTGLVLWVPGPDDSGSVLVNLSVTDNKSAPVIQKFRIDVQSVNNPPWFESLPVLIATQNQNYTYKAVARDPDNNQLTYSLVAGPRGMTAGLYTGDVRWRPNMDQVGLNRVVLSASDGPYTVYQSFCVTVINSNDDPVITSQPVTTALQGIPYSYQVQAYDPDGDELRYCFTASPSGMDMSSTSGLISWTPASDQVGNKLVALDVTDGHGGRTPQSFFVNVVNVNDPPRIESSPPSMARQGTLFTYRVQAFDPDGDPVGLSLLSWPRGMAINASSGVIEWVPGQESVGRVTVTVLASDGLGGIAYQNFDLSVQDVNDPPVFLGAIAPVAYQNQPYVTQVRAYDPDGDALTYTLVNQLEDIELDKHTGTLVWFPKIPQNLTLTIRVTDENGSNTDDYFNVMVKPSPAPPLVAPIGLLYARVGKPFSHTVAASDPAGGHLRFAASSGLFRINSTSGLMTFSPDKGDVGAHEFWVDVKNADGLNTTVRGVLVVDPEAGGLSLPKIAGFGLAGLGGADPRLILAITLLMGGLLFYQYARLRRREARERPVEAAILREEASRAATTGVTEEERGALLARQRQETEAQALAEKEPATRVRSAEDAGNKEMLERRAREWDAALREQRAAREVREKEEAERRARELSEREEREKSRSEEMERKASELKEKEEAERRAVLQSIQDERKVLSKEEAERLEREIELELAESGLEGLDDESRPEPPDSPPSEATGEKDAAPRTKISPKRTRRRG